MEKLKLDLDDLQVESFDVEPDAALADVVAYCGAPGGKQTTGSQIICDCSQFNTDCDLTCPGYWDAANQGCI